MSDLIEYDIQRNGLIPRLLIVHCSDCATTPEYLPQSLDNRHYLGRDQTLALVSLFIRAPDLGFLKPLCGKPRFLVFDPARKIRDTNP